MDIVILRPITNIEGMDAKLIKVWSVLFTLWKHGQYEDMKLPTMKELQKLVGLTDKPIKAALDALQKIRITDRYQQTLPLLHLSTKKLGGRMESVYKLAVPEFGELTDPTAFMEEGGGSATMGALGGYIILTDEIQKLHLPVNQELVLAVWNNIANVDGYRYPVYNARTPHIFRLLECMKFESVKRATYELYKRGYLDHSEPTVDKSWGWKSVSINLNPQSEEAKEVEEQVEDESDTEADHTEEENMVDTDKLQAMIDKAMDMGNMELAMELAKSLTAAMKGDAKPEAPKGEPKAEAPKPAKKPRKSDMEEHDYQNDYIKVYLSVPKNVAKNPTITNMISGLKDSLAYHWYTDEDVEASGYIDALKDYNIKMTYEVLQDVPKVESEPETLEDVIESSRNETIAYFNNEPEWVDKAVNAIVESGVLNKEKKEAPKPEPQQEAPKPKEKTPQQIAFEAKIEQERVENRKRAQMMVNQVEDLEAELDEIMELI